MLVIAPNIATAVEYCDHLSRHGAKIATSDDTKQAKTNIESFKATDEKCNILVTVGMAYEGLDVPEITHVACLTNIRSRPWIEQAICRANRTDHKHNKTHGYVYYPDDPRMKRIMDAIEAKQAALVMTWNPQIGTTPSGKSGPDSLPIVPLISTVTRERARGIDDGTFVDYGETRAIQEAMRLAGMPPGISVVQQKQFLVYMGVGVVPNGDGELPNYDENVLDDVPPSELEERLRKTIDRTIKRIAKGDGAVVKKINIEVRAIYGPRDNAPASTLKNIMRFLSERHNAVI